MIAPSSKAPRRNHVLYRVAPTTYGKVSSDFTDYCTTGYGGATVKFYLAGFLRLRELRMDLKIYKFPGILSLLFLSEKDGSIDRDA